MNKILVTLSFCILACFSCTEVKKDINLNNTYWISDISMDYNISEFTPSLLFSIGDNKASIKSLGYEDALFESPYFIEDDYFFIATKESPLMQIISKDSAELFVSLLPGDTTKFNRVYKSDIERGLYLNRFEDKTLQVGMGDNNLAGVIHFTRDEALNFSNDIFDVDSDKYLDLNFYRIPYGLGFTNSIPTLAMGKSMQAKVISKPGQDIRVQNYFAGSLDIISDYEIGVTLYQNDRAEKWSLIKVKKFEKAQQLLLGAWGRSESSRLVFKKGGKVDFTMSGVKGVFDWRLDPSGHLVIITQSNGNKIYVVHNLLRDKNRIGFEISRGKFKDLVRVAR